MTAPDTPAALVGALDTAKKPAPPLTSTKLRFCPPDQKTSGSAAATGEASVTERPALRLAHVPAHVSSILRTKVASVKAGGSFTSMSEMVTTA